MEVALALIAEPLLAAVIEVLVDRIASSEILDFFRSQNLDGGKLENLKATMRSVGKLLNDAEEKQITNSHVKNWLDDLKHAFYEADDFLDEIAYKAMQLKLEAETQGGTCSGQVQNFLSSLVPCKKGIFIQKTRKCKKGMGEMQRELEKILQTLQGLLQQKQDLGLVESIGEKASSRKIPTTSLLGGSRVYGRDVDKEVIMKLLLSDDAEGRRLDVIPILGMGGMGKTTLAQFVYKEIVVSNDRSLKNSFDLKAWVYVSEELDILKVTKDILNEVSSVTCDNMTENQIHCELQKKLMGNKVLLVLDDVWSDDQAHWEFLLKPFDSVGKGSKILVTTRNGNVAAICSTVPSYDLGKLSDDVCWSLLSEHAFGVANINTQPELEEIGREIAKKCNGLPLAAKTIGGLLRSKRDGKEWRKILKSNLWELPNDKIVSALWLSYHYLPSGLKRCFTYCAMYPKGYMFQREELVLLWMAEGFLVQAKGYDETEELGNEYFEDLVSRSFFQPSSVDPSVFIMHDLINDLARSFSGEFCMHLEDGDLRKIQRRTRHLAFTEIKEDSFQSFEGSCAPQSLRTLMMLTMFHLDERKHEVVCNLWPTLERLRVLSIADSVAMSVLSNSIGNLKHLRYLDISGAKITRLPESVCSLYNLEVLILRDCFELVELPANVVSLISLHHLDIRGTGLQEMPPQMGKLTKLRMLSDFHVGKQSDCGIKELGELQHLRGPLSIRNLQHVMDGQDALKANLKGKEHLEDLGLYWGICWGNCGICWGNSGNSQVQEGLLQQLQPHGNTKELTIWGYGGTRFPDWIGGSSLPRLQGLNIRFCRYLKKALFTHFPSLTTLSVQGCEQLEIECNPLNSFPKLESLDIDGCLNFSFSIGASPNPNITKFRLGDCSNLKSLPQRMHSLLPSLTALTISRCPELESFPEGGLPSQLQFLEIDGCNKLMANPMQWDLQSVPSLSHLRLRKCSNLKSLPQDMHSLLPSLRVLTISECPELESFPEGGLPSQLQNLEIDGCYKLIANRMQWDLQSLPSLSQLEIGGCKDVISFPEETLLPSTLTFLHICSLENLKSLEYRGLHHLTSLRGLLIASCPNLQSMPEEGLPPSLASLYIIGCPLLGKRCEKDIGEDWPKISHIPCLKIYR